MIHLVCLTKSYNENDFKLWYSWHKSIGVDRIHVYDNESTVNIKKFVTGKDTYNKITGWPNQWQMFSDILNHNALNMNKNDLVMFFDDDEYIWHNMVKPLETTLYNQFKLLGCVLVPQILMSTKDFQLQRSKNLIEQSYYRRNDSSNQGKCILLYDSSNEYDFTKEEQNEKGHVPFINGMRYSEVVGSDCSKTTYGLVDYDAPVRLYHYHVKSADDWKHKIERGSAACKVQYYDSDITKDKWYGKYEIIDLTMLNTAKKLRLV